MITQLPLMLDELLTAPIKEKLANIFGGVPVTRVGDTNLVMIPKTFVEENFDKTMDWAEKWAEREFGVSEVNIKTSADNAIIGPAMHCEPLRRR
jgi:hypothetical protein